MHQSLRVAPGLQSSESVIPEADVAVQRAILEAEATASVLEGLQVMRDEEHRSELRARLAVFAQRRDAESRAVREVMDKVATVRARTRRLEDELGRGVPEASPTSTLRACWRALLVVMWVGALFAGGTSTEALARAALPIAALWLALVVPGARP